LFLCVLLGGIGYTFHRYHPGDTFIGNAELEEQRHTVIDVRVGQPPVPSVSELREQLAALNARCVYVWFVLQNIAILVLTPAYVGGAIAEERESRTLELLFTSGLYDREIVIGKLAARVAHIGALSLAGLPIFSMMLVWGGIDTTLLVANWINSMAMLVSVSSVCLAISSLPLGTTTCVVISYAALFLPGAASLASLDRFPLVLQTHQLNGSMEQCVGIAAFYTLVLVICLLFAVRALRLKEMPPLAYVRVRADYAPADVLQKYAGFLTRLPPVRDDGLLWKERFTGGRSPLQNLEVLSLIILFAAYCVIYSLAATVVQMPNRATSFAETVRTISGVWGPPLRAVLYLGSACWALGVTFRAAGSIVREKQARTLDLLLQIPVDRRDILCAKWLGAILKGWPWIMVILVDLLLGTLIGAYHPGPMELLLFALPAFVACLCSIGLFVSALVGTRLQANLTMGVVLLALLVFAGLLIPREIINLLILRFSWWETPAIPASRMIAVVCGVAVLPFLAWLFWKGAAFLFERMGR
jgi:ABC-type transport system involved in multi-copper enzyme maturation permease subunit